MRTTRNTRRIVRRTLMALGFASLAAFGTVTLVPEARADDLQECLQIVDDFVDGCMGEDPGFWKKAGCATLGGLGYMGCIAGEVIKGIGKAGPALA